ncbi:MAG: hypothetical protein IH964_13360 [Candidatus Dadabacteria bacterium]|nr:hypothetical protein [Candidatus Dadabacteria bacterium]
MKAAVTTKPGSPEVIELMEKPIPSATPVFAWGYDNGSWPLLPCANGIFLDFVSILGQRFEFFPGSHFNSSNANSRDSKNPD